MDDIGTSVAMCTHGVAYREVLHIEVPLHCDIIEYMIITYTHAIQHYMLM